MEFDQGRLLRVRLLNGCELSVEGGSSLIGHKNPTKGERLIARLVLERGDVVPVEELLEIAGLDREDERSLPSLKVHIHRMRRRLSEMDPRLKDCVVTWKRGYSWNLESSTVDLFEAERVCKALLTITRLSALKMEAVEDLVKMFGQSLLPALREEWWVEQRARAFQMLYTDAMKRVLMLMWQVEAYELVIRTCHLGMVYAPYEQLFWENLTRAMHCVEQLEEDAQAERKANWMMVTRYIESVHPRGTKVVELSKPIGEKRWAQR